MKIIIHAGMPKTGSSSIQNYYAEANTDRLGYFPWYGPNHSALFILLFEREDDLTEFHGFKLQRRSKEFLLKIKAEWWETTLNYIKDSENDTFLLSAESISGASSYSISKLKDFSEKYFKQSQVIIYVRPPNSFMASAFQETIKGNTIDNFDLNNFWPHYKHRIEKIEEIFGAKNVSIRIFSKDALEGGNVITDFAEFTRLATPKVTSERSNEALSLDAVCALYLQRNMGDGFVTNVDNAIQKNDVFISVLQILGTTPFRFSDKFLEEAKLNFPGDVEWITNRVGDKFLDVSEQKDTIYMSNEGDILDHALKNSEKIDQLYRQVVSNADSNKTNNLVDLAIRLNEIRQYCYENLDALEKLTKVNEKMKKEDKSQDLQMKVAYAMLWANARKDGDIDEDVVKEKWRDEKIQYRELAEQVIFMMRKQDINI